MRKPLHYHPEKQKKLNSEWRSRNKFIHHREDHKQTGTIKKLLKIILLISAICLGIYYFFISDIFIIENIKTEINGQASNNPEILRILNKYKYKNIFLVKSEDIKQEVKNINKNSAFLDIQKELPNTIKIVIQEYKDMLNVSLNIDNIEKKIVLNQNGAISQENFHEEDLPLLFMKSTKHTSDEEFYLSKEEIDYILGAKKYFEEKFNILIDYINYYQLEHEIHLITEKEFEVWLDMEQPYLTQLYALKVALSELDIFSTPLLYIDLRIVNGEKVIFKKK